MAQQGTRHERRNELVVVVACFPSVSSSLLLLSHGLLSFRRSFDVILLLRETFLSHERIVEPVEGDDVLSERRVGEVVKFSGDVDDEMGRSLGGPSGAFGEVGVSKTSL